MRGVGMSDGKDLSSAIKKIRFFRSAYSFPAPLLPHFGGGCGETGSRKLRDPSEGPVHAFALRV
jgi:hypothetical protein